ncbi:hypothetical protein GCM10009737_16080 [Nocardioides lentus]|uniref:Uncharacterized protein n=2 Tax=Nocardioides lentus TaxID=338077 RepID=A0ABP5AJ80_9ACTN
MYRATYAGPEARMLKIVVPPNCLQKREFQNIPKYKVNQKSYDVAGGPKTEADALAYTRFLTARR